MNWNPPTAPTLPPPAVQQPPAATPPEAPSERRARSAAPAAAWIGLLGATLVLTAATVVLTRSWPAYGELVRALALALGAAVATFAAGRFRRQVPVTASIDAHVGAFLTVPTGIATVAMFGGTWPACLIVGGLAGVIATELQARRWSERAMHAGQIAAVCLATTGGAALTGLTAGLLATVAAVALTVLGADRRACTLAGLAVVSPVLVVCERAGFGPGTLERAGLVGERLDWSSPIVGVLAGAVFFVAAWGTGRSELYAAAVLAPLIGSANRLDDVERWLGSFLDRYDITTTDRWCAAISLIALGVGLLVRRGGRTSSWVAYSLALTISGLWLVLTVAGRNPGWAIPTALTVGIVAAGLGAWHRLGAPLVGGTAIVGTTLMVASWQSLAGTPTWVWLAAGGAALLGLAVLIERAGLPGKAELQELVDRWD